jgi:hypothetical protein
VAVRFPVPDPDVPGDGRGLVFPPLVLPALLVMVEDKVSICAWSNVFRRDGEELDGSSPIHRDLIELGEVARGELPVPMVVQAGRPEDHVGPVGGEGEGGLVRRMPGQPPGLPAPGGNQEDIEVAVPIRGEGDPLPIGAPHRAIVMSRVGGESHRLPAPGRHPPEVSLVGEGNRAPVGRDGGVAEPACLVSVLGGDARGQEEGGDGGKEEGPGRVAKAHGRTCERMLWQRRDCPRGAGNFMGPG